MPRSLTHRSYKHHRSSHFDRLSMTSVFSHVESVRLSLSKPKRILKIILFLITFLFFLLNQSGYAQEIIIKPIPELNHFLLSDIIKNRIAKELYFNNILDDSLKTCINIHPEIKPYRFDDLTSSTSVLENWKTVLNFGYKFKSNYFSCFAFRPIVNSLYYLESKNVKTITENSFGFTLNYRFWRHYKKRGIEKDNLFAYSLSYTYNASAFPDYIKSQIAKAHVVPGQGYAKSVDWGYRYQNLSFYAAKNAGKYFVFETGFGKHFLGDGHRSLFLSDAAYSYPYFKITISIWKIKYVNMWTNFKDITCGYDNWFKADNKYGAFHFLSWNATKRLNINLFEAVIWAGKTENHTRNFDVNYLNPIIFYRPVEFSLGSPDNVLLGVGSHYKIGTKHVLYTQILLDEFLLKEVRTGFAHMFNPSDSTLQYGSWFNKQAWQLGYKYFDVAGIKYLNFQTEFNYVRPYTYSHRVAIQNYGHFNEPLAHPLGANFWESVSFLRYTKNKWYFETEFLYYVTGLDSNGTHYGQDIFKPTYDTYEPGADNIIVNQYGNKVAQGIKNTVNFVSLKASYLLFSPLNLRLEAGFLHRTQNSVSENKKTNYFFFGIKTSLDNRYYDF